jgi:hypothetical protein
MIHAVAASRDRKPAAAVLGERVEHVVEEVDVGIDRDRAAVQREPKLDLRFLGGALDERAPVDQLCAPFVALPLAEAAFPNR